MTWTLPSFPSFSSLNAECPLTHFPKQRVMLVQLLMLFLVLLFPSCLLLLFCLVLVDFPIFLSHSLDIRLWDWNNQFCWFFLGKVTVLFSCVGGSFGCNWAKG
jgi:hypothetical protein